MTSTEKEHLRSQQAERTGGDRGNPAALHRLGYPLRQARRTHQYVDGAYLRGHPELELFPTDEQRRRAVRRIVSKFLWQRAFWLAVAKTPLLAVLLGLLVVALLVTLRTWYPWPVRTILPRAVLPFVLLAGVAVFFANRWMSRTVPGLLRHELLDCGVPICVSCGYPLFGLPGPNCPECGTQFDERAQRILDADTAETEKTGSRSKTSPTG